MSTEQSMKAGAFNPSPLGANSITVYRPMLFGPTAPTNSMDLMVLVHLLFSVREGRHLTPMTLLAELKECGVQSTKNANELVGRNNVYESIARLIGLGYVRRIELPNEKHPGRRGPMAYQVFEDPSQNPAVSAAASEAAEESSQVGMLPRTPEAGFGQFGHSDVSAGQNASPNAGSGVPASGVRGSWQNTIPAGQNASPNAGSWTVSPPHPPVVGTTPPIPPVAPVPSVSADAGTGRGRGNRSANKTNPAQVTPELKAAVTFLMELPKPFACGLRHAKRFAPKLLTAMAFLGWERPDEYLAMELVAKSADGLADPPAAIGVRIENLRPRHIVVRDRAKPAPQTPPQAPCPTHPRLEAAGCPQCAAADAVDLQRRELDAAKGIDDESARRTLAAMLANRSSQSRAARGREHATRQGEQAREEAAKRAAYLRDLEALSG